MPLPHPPHTLPSSPQVIAQRLSKLQSFKRSGGGGRLPADVVIKRKRRGKGSGGNGEGAALELVRARGHLDEVHELRKGGSKLGEWAGRGQGGWGEYNLLGLSVLWGGSTVGNLGPLQPGASSSDWTESCCTMSSTPPRSP
jgi:hypothetical protein